jgi:DNA modification methylase
VLEKATEKRRKHTKFLEYTLHAMRVNQPAKLAFNLSAKFKTEQPIEKGNKHSKGKEKKKTPQYLAFRYFDSQIAQSAPLKNRPPSKYFSTKRGEAKKIK